ncbi:neurogenic locus notch-like protein 1 [Caerostris extrusa]|uniref:Neurogenic locus notch-like protein 1 n=1 Tax=Caerostris extrusa TaxID=172846 RepID=A0AAV4RIF2_CAEEX|nr:neurogenic locus notch-like protein 1 [Caerostris extrusa]
MDKCINGGFLKILCDEYTDGDIIITSEPETGSDVTSNDNSTPSEENTTDFITTNVSVTTEITTQPVTAIWTACSSNPCKNGGLCQESSDPRVYNCNCARGYTGTHCQVYDDCSTDENGNICYKGTCTYRSDGLSRFCSCFFGMFWDDDLKECRETDPPVFQTRVTTELAFRMETNFGVSATADLKGIQTYTKHCKCNSGFYWNSEKGNCEAVVPPCLPNPCRNKGTCEVISTKEFNCICTDGYKGSNCEIQDFCLISKSGDDICENGNCVTSEDSMTCVCNEGYYLEEESHTCKSIVKPCLPNPCLNNGKCTPLPSDSYNCTCSEGYLGATCNELDFCVLKGGNTFCGNAECRNDNDLKIYYCSCGNDQYFDYSTRTCIDVDFCHL